MANPPELKSLDVLSDQPSPQNPTLIERAATGNTAHLDAALDAATADEATVAAIGAVDQAAQFMPRDEWCKFFLKAHGVAGGFMHSRVFLSVPDRQGGTEAAGEIYDMCAETPALHWMIQPEGKWFKRAIIIGSFYGPIAMEFRQERLARMTVPGPKVAKVEAVPGEPAPVAMAVD